MEKKCYEMGLLSISYAEWDRYFPPSADLGLQCFVSEFVRLTGNRFADNIIMMYRTKWTDDFRKYDVPF